ncbi:MAG: hypothetical protein GWO20_18535 [Candidatus Korarchaeota archaeon]|nr:hypothetical protein [Candidatus Korarchaeota archaeon]NIU85290.1 hypothetical protein [Candidatus Thorarchaeota archaeon]NIW15388.1 hypothetical protein [Candidatus Thorarchaeota archaeon]NIW53334.1 hypothetical protein [Candidatus Korarchaeota archaeon]
MHERNKSELSDIAELKEVLNVISETIPSLIAGIKNAIYDAESSKQLAENTANFYGNLVDQGLDENKAYELTREYLRNHSFTKLITEILRGIPGLETIREKRGLENIEEQVRTKVEEKRGEDIE